MKPPRLMILTSTIPNDYGVGSIWMRDLCQLYGPSQIAYFCVHKPYTEPRTISPELSDMTYEEIYGPRLLGISKKRFGSFVRKISGMMISKYGQSQVLKRQIDEAVEFGRRNGVEKLLIILHDTYSILMAAEVAKKLQVELVKLQRWIR